MKKSLLISIFKEISEKYPAIFVDLDMSAAHTRIARYLLADPNSQLDSALKDDMFWATQITNLMPIFESANIELNPKIVKKILKVGLYTSLNGGNPASPERLRANISLNASDYIEKHQIRNVVDLDTDPITSATRKVFEAFPLIEEVKSLNEICVNASDRENLETYTIDRVQPYPITSPHLGISRVLQGFEVVLLSVLVRDILEAGHLPISFDHDGVLILCPKAKFGHWSLDDDGCIISPKQPDPIILAQRLLVKSPLISGGPMEAVSPEEAALCVNEVLFPEWSKYLLGEALPLEVKRIICNGHVTEY